jgi:hypothetical protein
MPTEKIIVINSRDKISGTNSNFRVQFQDSISQEVLKILVKDVFVPNQFYNVDADNNTLDLNQNGLGLVQAIVTPGQYNIDELIVALKTAIDAELVDGAVVAITKNTNTNQLTFTFTTATNPLNNNVSFLDTSTMKELIGFSNTLAQNTVLTMPNPWNLNPLQYVQIHSQALASNHGMDGGANTTIGLLETVSLNETPFGGVAHRKNDDDELSEIIYDDQRTLNQIDIKIRNASGKILTLPDNHHISIMVKAYF